MVCCDPPQKTTYRLLNRTAYLRKDIVRVRSDQADRAHDNYENDGQHDGIFRDILALFVIPELL